MWGGCWCTWFHPRRKDEGLLDVEPGRPYKELLVREGRAHAALVCSTEERPWAGVSTEPRLTCFLVDRDYRRTGVAAVALRGALHPIAQAGGGVVEGYPQDTQGKKTSSSFLYNATRSMFEKAGFSYERPKGTRSCVMRRTVAAG